MFKIIDRPDSGKTKKLLEKCSKDKGLFVCAHPDRVFDKCRAYGIDPVAACNYDQYLYDADYNNWEKVYIDEIDKFIREYNKGRVKGYSMTIDNYE